MKCASDCDYAVRFETKTPDRYEIFIINFKLVQHKGKKREMKKISYIRMFSVYVLTENISQN
jgi:hypothetical protein